MIRVLGLSYQMVIAGMNIFIRNPLKFFDVLRALHFSKCGLYVNVKERCRREIEITLGSVPNKLYAFRM